MKAIIKQKQQNLNKNWINDQEELESFSEYETAFEYQNQIIHGVLKLEEDLDLKEIEFIRALNIHKLELINCKKIIPKLQIRELIIESCDIKSLEEFQLNNLEVLILITEYKFQETSSLVQEMIQFTKLKELVLTGWMVDPGTKFCQINQITRLSLNNCEIRQTKYLTPLTNLQELSLNENKRIDITHIQYLANLSKLQLYQCDLVNMDSLRPLSQLQELDIRENQIVFIQPLAKLAFLTFLNAQINYIIDTEVLERHKNFKLFKFCNKFKPSHYLRKSANIMRLINNPITSLKFIREQSNRLQQHCTMQKKKMDEYQQQLYDTQKCFIEQTIAIHCHFLIAQQGFSIVWDNRIQQSNSNCLFNKQLLFFKS
ncbi:leucine-rich_repeat domain-containing protein [Hexamita inflata]|uniref:Leucine-rich repeat domain-containing protein n=1 Tax=Hexamita inflata TaxID=28002 RepID=A0AA86PH81_9EUKA|nr:leucine-rich repeat domain-containing protein [Hexamita inflata]